MNALHIIGGDVIYECRGVDSLRKETRFKITFTMYRDSKSNGAQFDDGASFGIYRGSSTWTHFRTINGIDPISKQEIPIETQNPCLIVPLNLGVERGVYTFEVVLPWSDLTYMIAYQRCCRNNTILNLVSPGDTGAAFTTEISPIAQTSCNNSPVFKSFPPVIICVNRPINFDHSAIDIDGDSLVYEFCSPLMAGGTAGSGGNPGLADQCNGVRPAPSNCPPPFDPVVFKSPNYAPNTPMAGSPIVTINDVTGRIDGNANILGQHVVGVCVKEYRKGVLIGILRRDFQFNVTTCENGVRADIKATTKTPTEYFINSCGDYTINFLNESTDQRFIQDYYWEFNIQGNIQTYTSRDVSVTFPGLGTYKATMILNKNVSNTAECSDTASIVVNVYPSINADFIYQYDTCQSGPIKFKDLSVSGAGSIQKWGWDFGEGRSQNKDPEFEYENVGLKNVKLVVEDVNKCRDTMIQNINYYPVPGLIVIDPNTFIGCLPADIYFKNLSEPIDDTYKLKWDFGDGSAGSNEYSPTHTYNEIGTYNVSLEIVSPIGCKTVKNWNRLIKVVPSPTAGFSYSPEDPNIFDNVVQFTDESINAIKFLWVFDSANVSNLQSPIHTFKDTGYYQIKQIVLHPSGCSDTATADIFIRPFVNFFVPNAFTPNGDGLNDQFIPVGLFEGVRLYNFSVWNRWGEMIFETQDYQVGWNGQRQNNGSIAPQGVYTYLITYLDGENKNQTSKGFFTLIR